MNRSGKVYFKEDYCGQIFETDDGYRFQYDFHYLQNKTAQEISFTMPLSDKTFESKTMFPFFDGLIPEGWLLDIAELNWKVNYKDRMGLLLVCCRDCIGAVSVRKDEKF
jgi:serine/threonine-protein kinase HipA